MCSSHSGSVSVEPAIVTGSEADAHLRPGQRQHVAPVQHLPHSRIKVGFRRRPRAAGLLPGQLRLHRVVFFFFFLRRWCNLSGDESEPGELRRLHSRLCCFSVPQSIDSSSGWSQREIKHLLRCLVHHGAKPARITSSMMNRARYGSQRDTEHRSLRDGAQSGGSWGPGADRSHCSVWGGTMSGLHHKARPPSLE